jgi:molybdenum cofactor cytidylyltransferase
MICAIVLAAGRSERMGTQKLLLPLGGKPVIARVVDELSCSPVDEIFVVVGSEGERLRETLIGKRVRFVENPDTAGDMLGSVRCGLRALPKDCKAALVALGDQPGITTALVDELSRCFHQGEANIVVPTCNGHRGHPVLISSQYFDEVMASHTTTGLRGFLNAHSKETLSVAASEVAAMDDMDTPADYDRQKKWFAKLLS